MRRTSLIAVVLLAPGCGDAGTSRVPSPESAATAESAAVTVYFTRDEAPVAVTRTVPGSDPDLRVALEILLQGPAAAEREQGITSWFSAATAGRLLSAAVDGTGRAIVDFDDLPSALPNASSSTGSTLLLQELNGTVFADPDVRSVEYRSNGSCEAFWNWLQYDCRIVTRPGS